MSHWFYWTRDSVMQLPQQFIINLIVGHTAVMSCWANCLERWISHWPQFCAHNEKFACSTMVTWFITASLLSGCFESNFLIVRAHIEEWQNSTRGKKYQTRYVFCSSPREWITVLYLSLIWRTQERKLPFEGGGFTEFSPVFRNLSLIGG